MTIYYAHCVAIYHTMQEQRDIDLLRDVFFPGTTIINPSDAEWETLCQEERRRCHDHNKMHPDDQRDPGGWVMEHVFKRLATTASDVLVFRALPDGRIPAGVDKEITWAREHGNPVLELPSNLSGRGMTVAQTREYLREIGVR